jgi:hypothetical protein
MAWRITYWRGVTPVRVTTVEEATTDEIKSLLQKLAAKQLDLEYLRASTADKPETPEVRSDRSARMFWTIGKDFHYTAEWSSKTGRGKPKP